MDVREAREHPAVEQRKRGALVAALPQLPGGGTDIVRKASGPDVEIAYVRRSDERVLAGRDEPRARDTGQVDDNESRERERRTPDEYARRLPHPDDQTAHPRQPPGPLKRRTGGRWLPVKR